jgi:DNA polymerase III subunit epsilon
MLTFLQKDLLPMKNHKLAFVDLETTGLDPLHHEIIEIGIVLAVQKVASDGHRYLELTSEHNIQLIPTHIENADPKALEVNKYYKRDWSGALPQHTGLVQAAELLDGAIFIAQNVTGDWAFLLKSGDDYGVSFDTRVHYHKLDLASMVFGKLYHEEKLFKYSLRELTEYFGVTNQNAHTALADARATFEVCRKLLSTDQT